MWLLMAALPSSAIGFFIIKEMPIGLKRYIYKMPVWISSTLINILIASPLSAWMVGPLAVFVGEFILWPLMAWDAKRVEKIVRTLEKNGYKVKVFRSNDEIMKLYRELKDKRSSDKISRSERKLLSLLEKIIPRSFERR